MQIQRGIGSGVCHFKVIMVGTVNPYFYIFALFGLGTHFFDGSICLSWCD